MGLFTTLQRLVYRSEDRAITFPHIAPTFEIPMQPGLVLEGTTKEGTQGGLDVAGVVLSVSIPRGEWWNVHGLSVRIAAMTTPVQGKGQFVYRVPQVVSAQNNYGVSQQGDWLSGAPAVGDSFGCWLGPIGLWLPPLSVVGFLVTSTFGVGASGVVACHHVPLRPDR